MAKTVAMFVIIVSFFLSGEASELNFEVSLSEFEEALLEAQASHLQGVLGCSVEHCLILLSDPQLQAEPVVIPVEYINLPGQFQFELPNFSKFSSNWTCIEICKLTNQRETLYYNPYRGIILLSTDLNPLCYEASDTQMWCANAIAGRKNYFVILVPRQVS